MPRLIGVCNEETKRKLGRRQMEVEVDEMRTMIVEMEDVMKEMEMMEKSEKTPPMNMKTFNAKMTLMKKMEEREEEDVLAVNIHDFYAFIAHIACIGCRRGLEKTFVDTAAGQHNTFEPFCVVADEHGHPALTIRNTHDPKLLHRTLVANYNRCRALLDTLTKCKKNCRRCHLHSIDSHVCRNTALFASWQDIWALMAVECREEVCIVESDMLLDMLESYLQKHRFCPDCKGTLMRAYRCLVGETDVTKEKGYNAKLYQGLRYCSKEGHLHIKGCVNFLDSLVARAETDLSGSSRERHAKTLEVGQLEVLTCLGLFMHGRLHRLTNAIKSAQTSYQLFYCAATTALYGNFQTHLESKDNLNESFERLCQELQHSAANPQKSQGAKCSKKKTKKAKGEKTIAVPHTAIDSDHDDLEEPSTRCSVLQLPCKNLLDDEEESDQSPNDHSDAGYMSREGSPSALPEIPPSLPKTETPVSCDSCSEHKRQKTTALAVPRASSLFHCCDDTTTLSDMLNERQSPTMCTIAEEDINWFAANQSTVCEQRDALRKRIGEQFKAMQTRLAMVASD